MTKALYQILASTLQAYDNCTKNGATQSQKAEWTARHRDAIYDLVEQFMPRGSGIDSGTKIAWDESTPNKLVFTTAFHHMDENGYYDGWTEHKVIVTPSLSMGYDLKITGRDRNDIKDYLAEVYTAALDEEIEQTAEGFTCPRIVESARKFQEQVKAGSIV